MGWIVDGNLETFQEILDIDNDNDQTFENVPVNNQVRIDKSDNKNKE